MELKPCPFCGEKPNWYCYPKLSGVECRSCKFSISSHGPESDEQRVEGKPWTHALMGRWNRRAEVEA